MKKIIAIILVVLIVGVALASSIKFEGDGGTASYAGVESLTVVVENVNRSTTNELTLTVPGSISLTQKISDGLGISDISKNTATITDPDDEFSDDDIIRFHVLANVWWSGENMQSVDEVTFSQTASRNTFDFTNQQGDQELSESVASGLPIDKSESDPLTIEPTGTYGDFYYATATQQLTAQLVDGSTVSATVTIQGTDVNGDTVTDSIDLSATIGLTITEGGSLSISAELDSVDAETY